MFEIQKDSIFDLQLILTTSSILSRYGDISEMIKNDGFQVNEKIFTLIEGETPSTMAKSTGLGLIEISSCFSRLKPDLVFVVGDRFETMSSALAASYMNIPIAHTMGGEVTGTIDESIRHSLTKLSHLHFPASKDAAKRVERLGEKKKSIFNVGCPRIDFVKEVLTQKKEIDKLILSKGVGEKIDINNPFLILSYHPVTTEYGQIDKQMKIILSVIDEIQYPTIILWPNADAGSADIAKVIRIFREKNKLTNARFFKNLPTETYIQMLNKTYCLIGNSSSGIREGNFIGVPCVNIGTRQQGRERGNNVIDVDLNKTKIINAIFKQIKIKKYKQGKVYGNGDAAKKIVKVLKNIKSIDIQKRISY
tara:strand:- start:6339 stop:7430 length:1092 start_codon:yes stop_codon:yes gene_type:complete